MNFENLSIFREVIDMRRVSSCFFYHSVEDEYVWCEKSIANSRAKERSHLNEYGCNFTRSHCMPITPAHSVWDVPGSDRIILDKAGSKFKTTIGLIYRLKSLHVTEVSAPTAEVT